MSSTPPPEPDQVPSTSQSQTRSYRQSGLFISNPPSPVSSPPPPTTPPPPRQWSPAYVPYYRSPSPSSSLPSSSAQLVFAETLIRKTQLQLHSSHHGMSGSQNLHPERFQLHSHQCYESFLLQQSIFRSPASFLPMPANGTNHHRHHQDAGAAAVHIAGMHYAMAIATQLPPGLPSPVGRYLFPIPPRQYQPSPTQTPPPRCGSPLGKDTPDSSKGRIVLYCGFCASSQKHDFENHNLKDENGIVRCPILRSLVCKFCGATGDNAHTPKYCPSKDQQQQQQQQQSPE